MDQGSAGTGLDSVEIFPGAVFAEAQKDVADVEDDEVFGFQSEALYHLSSLDLVKCWPS